MKQQTAYHYQKRIKELEVRARKAEDALYNYKQLTKTLFTSLCDKVHSGHTLSQGWMLKQFERLFQ